MDQPSRARWRRRKEARPDEILEAALACFAERGYAAARLDDIAERAGVTKGTLYLYFPGKEELFKAVIRGTFVPRLAELEAIVADSTETAPALLDRLIRVFAGLAGEARVAAIPKLVIAEAGNFPDLARFYVEEVVARGLGLIKGILRRGIAAGAFRPIDVDAAAFCVAAPLVLSMLWKQALEPLASWSLDLAALGPAHADLLRRGLADAP